MINILFVCHGNICRSPMAEFMLKKMIVDYGYEKHFYIQSAAVSNEEKGNPVYPPASKKLQENGIDSSGKRAVKLTKQDYNKFDYILAMEKCNLIGIEKIIGSDDDKKIRLLLDFSDNPRDIADPWYTGDFDRTYNDILEGLKTLFEYIRQNHKEELK